MSCIGALLLHVSVMLLCKGIVLLCSSTILAHCFVPPLHANMLLERTATTLIGSYCLKVFVTTLTCLGLYQSVNYISLEHPLSELAWG